MALPHNSFELLAFLLIAAVVNPVGVEEKNVSGTHQRNLRDIGGIHSSRARLHGEVLLTVGMIFWDLQSQSYELRHPGFVDWHELAIFRREDQRRRVPETDEP